MWVTGVQTCALPICNDGDPTVLQPIGSGIGHIAMRARRLGVDPLLVLVAINYGRKPGELKSASVFMDVPSDELPEKPIAISRHIAGHLQEAVNRAVELY